MPDLRDPYTVLRVSKGFTLDELRRNYKALAMQLHPDKHKMPDHDRDALFKLLTESYKILKDIHDQCQADKQFDVLRAASASVTPYPAPSSVTGHNFNVSKFNAVFESSRVAEPTDQGYGDWMRDNSPEACKERQAAAARALATVRPREPEALISGTVGFTELGVEEISDFTGSARSLTFADYRDAHMNQSMLLDVTAVKPRKSFATVEDLQKHRKSVSFVMSERETAKQAAIKVAEVAREERRQLVQRRHDALVAADFMAKSTQLLGPSGGMQLLKDGLAGR